MRIRLIALVGVVLLALLASVAVDPSTPGTGENPAPERLYSPEETGSHLWPYTSRTRSIEGRTLAINVVVRADPEELRTALVDRSDGNWTEVEGDDAGAVGGDDAGAVGDDDAVGIGASPWRPARGAARYTYVAPDRNAAGTWVRAEYQLGTGAYLGRRIHIRVYPAPGSDWNAIQAHAEYWDWFRLRHTVTGIRPGAQFIERDLRDEPFVDRVAREYHGYHGGGSDGWTTTIEFAAPLALVGAVAVGHRRDWLGGRWSPADVALPVALAGVLLGVRSLGLAVESAVPAADPRIFAAGLYPVIAFGPPALVVWLASDRPPERTAAVAGGGLGTGVVLDLLGVGVREVPVRLALHRFALCCALGLFALGIARGDRRIAGAGALAWLLALAGPLSGYV
ncbi:hypothetical protein [Halobaculum magnesiiphilum]|uniref:Uncharacterized protein n=1 Tax=Halobaculum magnesiiphilum TaxID=1017351 RepID=A0A8T8WA84_9EURY|nr:hypothetical protein [Halobaculum magnesiiphilum]QZP36772.1 hypothetical protein K6T50_10705 [Halobaculum magnesiiphilum]